MTVRAVIARRPAGDDAIATERRPAITRPARGETSAAPVLRAVCSNIPVLFVQIFYFCNFCRHADVYYNVRPISAAVARARPAPLFFCCYLAVRSPTAPPTIEDSCGEGRARADNSGENSKKQQK